MRISRSKRNSSVPVARHPISGRPVRSAGRLLLPLAVTLMLGVSLAASPERAVKLRSGVITPNPRAQAPQVAPGESERWVVRFNAPPGWTDRGRLEAAGARVDTPLPGQAYLVSVPRGGGDALRRIQGVDWATPYQPGHKIAPDIAGVGPGEDASGDVIVMLHLFADASAADVAAQLSSQGLQVTGAGDGSRFDRIVLLMDAEQVEAQRDQLAARNDVFWVGRRYRRTLQNDDVVWVDQSGLEANQATPVFDHGIHGQGQIAAVLDTGLDADSCYFRDGTLGLPPTNTGGGTTVDMSQRKVIAVDFLDPTENPADPTHWDTQGHGSHVTGTLVGDDLANVLIHDPGDGMAPGAKVVIQDAGYAPDDCGDLPGIGCPVTDLVPVFQQAYDQGARVHNNSWNDNENAAVQNTYTDASEDVDAFTWNNPDFLVLFGAGNNALGGYGTMGSPGTCKNGMSVGATYNSTGAIYLSDISAWGPTDDGRIKPDVLSPGASIQSADNDFNAGTNNCGTRGSTGTSMASPGAAGAALLIRQYFADGFYPTGAANAPDAFNPSAALVKAMLVNSAYPIEFDTEGNPITIPGIEQGWGRVLLDDALHFPGDARKLWVDDHTSGFLNPSDPPVTVLLEVLDSSEPLKVTLAWSDFPSTPAASSHLVNDLDLRVVGDSGSFWGNSFRGGGSWTLGSEDRVNNLEQVLIHDPAPGIYSVQVSPHAVPSGPQPFALVVSGAMAVNAGPRPGYVAHTVDDSGPNGNGDGILDPGETAVIPVTLRNYGDAGATGVLGTLFSANPDRLKVYGATASYADMPVGAQQTSNVPHYEVTLEPSASCGQWLGTSMQITGDGFDVGSSFLHEIGRYEGDRVSVDTPLTIPKSAPDGIYSSATVDSSFPITEVDVTVSITHADISQLRLVLYAPDNSLVILKDFGGPAVADINTTYDELTEPDMGSMQDFIGTDPQGNWRLRVLDNVGGGTQAGTLNDWTLHFKSDIPFDCNPVGCGEPVPPAVDGLVIAKTGASDITLSWTGVGASDYNVWTSGDARFLTAEFEGASGGATTYVDAGVQGIPGLVFYQVRSVNSCRWESP